MPPAFRAIDAPPQQPLDAPRRTQEITREGDDLLDGQPVADDGLEAVLAAAPGRGVAAEREIHASPEASLQPVNRAVALAQAQPQVRIRLASMAADQARPVASAPRQGPRCSAP